MRSTAVTFIFGLFLAAPLGAQQAQGAQERENRDEIPAAYRPPAGMCRIWVDGVPAAQQPAPTDCAAAIRNRPANGRVLFGDDYARRETKKDDRKSGESIKGFLGGRDIDWRKDKEKPKKP